MKFAKLILEAVHRGVRLALDDYENNVEQSQSISDVIDVKDDVLIFRYNVLLNKFKCLIVQSTDPDMPIFMSKKEFDEFVDISLSHDLKYKFTNTETLAAAIKNIQHFYPNSNLNFFDISNITSLNNVFMNSSFNGDISEWDTHNVKTMFGTFAYSKFNGDISKWDVSNVEKMLRTFECAEFNQDISTWDMSNVSDISYMFLGNEKFNQNISKWNLSSIVSDASAMKVFNGCPIKKQYRPKFKCAWETTYRLVESENIAKLALDDIEDFNFNSTNSNDVINSEEAVKDIIDYEKLYPLFKTSMVDELLARTNSKILPEDDVIYPQSHRDIRVMTYSEYIQFRNLLFKLGIKYKVKDKDELKRIIHNVTRVYEHATENLNFLDVSNVTDMSYLTQNSYFNCDISDWDVSNVTRMEYMFAASKFNGDISKWNVSKVTNMSCMFKDSMFNQDISNWDVSSLEYMPEMFARCPFNHPLNDWNVSNVKSMTYVFEFNPNFNQPLDKWNVSNVNDFSRMFKNAESFCQNLSKWQTKPKARHYEMFGGKNRMKRQYKPKFT